VYALYRYGGTLERLKTLSLTTSGADRAGYDRCGGSGDGPLPADAGYDDAQGWSSRGQLRRPQPSYTYEHIQESGSILIISTSCLSAGAPAELYDLLVRTPTESELPQRLRDRRQEAIADNDDAFAWFNMGSMLVELGMYETRHGLRVAAAHRRDCPGGCCGISSGRISLQRDGPLRGSDLIADRTMSDGGGQYVERLLYAASPRSDGDTERAITITTRCCALIHSTGAGTLDAFKRRTG